MAQGVGLTERWCSRMQVFEDGRPMHKSMQPIKVRVMNLQDLNQAQRDPIQRHSRGIQVDTRFPVYKLEQDG